MAGFLIKIVFLTYCLLCIWSTCLIILNNILSIILCGGFSFNFLPVGTYDLTVQAPGFQALERRGLIFAAGQTLRLDLQLQVGGEIQSITVSGQEPLVQLSTSDQLSTLTNRQVVQPE